MKLTLIIIIMVSFLSSLFGSRENFISQNNADFAKTISDKNVQLVDVRTPEEFSESHIPGAFNIDVKNQNFSVKVDSLDKERAVAVYCRSGARSKVDAKILSDKGYKVYNLANGIMNWDGPTEK